MNEEYLQIEIYLRESRASLIAQLVKNQPARQETPTWFPGQDHLLEKGKATHSSILTWRIPWTTVHVKKKDKLDGFLSSCYAAPLQDPLEQNRCPVAPRSGMQVHTPGVIPSKPRIFLTDLGSLELSSRGKGTEKTCVWRWLCLSRSQSQG